MDPERGERAPRPPGFRVGPIVFVPEFRPRGESDPWSHRKGEPRTFALLFSVYLLFAALMTVFAVRALGRPPSHAQHGFGAASMVVLIALGQVVVYPLVRLSQVAPRRAGPALAADLAVLLLPIQAIVWPMPLLTNWRWEVVAGLLCLLLGWTLVAGAIVVLAQRASASAGARTTAMALLLALTLLAPGLRLVGAWGGVPTPDELLARLSPWTAPFAMTGGPRNVRVALERVDWLGALVPCGVGLAALPAALCVPVASERRGDAGPRFPGTP